MSVGGDTCAHYASNALARAGFDITSPHDTIHARCKKTSENGRVLRAKNLRDWIKAKGYTEYTTKPVGTACFFYCERDKDG